MAITRSMRRNYQSSNSTVSVNFYLPLDLIFDILSRLPAKTLLRFKSVCKTWYAVIKNPNFIKKHQTRCRHNLNQALKSVLINGYVSKLRMHSLQLLSRDNTDYSKPNPNCLFEYNPRVVGICDGLVCANFGNSETIICNPTTGRIRTTSRFSLLIKQLDFVFFGFEFQDNDYKLFRILYSSSWNRVFVRAEVYSMSSDVWREIQVTMGDFIVRGHIMDCGFCKSTPVAINGVLYCGGSIPVYTCVVASFDMNRYVFDLIECPAGLIRKARSWWQLLEFKGQLALTSCSGTHWFEMWVLNENDKSWTKKLRTNNLRQIGRSLRSVGFDRNDKLVMQYNLSNGAIKLFTYDPESHEIVYLPFPKLKDCGGVYLYTESLLLL